MSATWTMKQINASYPNVLSMAQNRSTGQYMLAIVTASASGTVDIVEPVRRIPEWRQLSLMKLLLTTT